ncbi:UNVERIFIED_CONTAM: hypothetical protein FKN15_019097 [Acipenser sinensis]
MDGVREMAEESEVNLPVEEEDKEKEGIWCLRRVGKKCEWLLLNEETEDSKSY